MNNISTTLNTNLTMLRGALLDLHRAVISHVQRDYEREHGRVSPADFLLVLVNERDYAWLSPLSQAIIGIDEAMDDPEEADPAAAVARVRSLFRSLFSPKPAPGEFGKPAPGEFGKPTPGEFSVRYEPLLQASPDVLFSHGKVMQALRA